MNLIKMTLIHGFVQTNQFYDVANCPPGFSSQLLISFAKYKKAIKTKNFHILNGSSKTTKQDSDELGGEN